MMACSLHIECACIWCDQGPDKCVSCADSVYHGEAINPKYLSFVEKYILRYGKDYNPAKEMEIRKAEFAVAK